MEVITPVTTTVAKFDFVTVNGQDFLEIQAYNGTSLRILLYDIKPSSIQPTTPAEVGKMACHFTYEVGGQSQVYQITLDPGNPSDECALFAFLIIELKRRILALPPRPAAN